MRSEIPFVTVDQIRIQLAETLLLYSELLMAVESKHPGETRHQTALRYIRETEAAYAEVDAVNCCPHGNWPGECLTCLEVREVD